MVLYDDISPSEKVKIYDHGVDKEAGDETPFRPRYRSGDVLIPKCDDREAVALAIEEFVSCVQSRRSPASDAFFGLDVVRILEASDRSIARNGERVALV